MKRPRLLAGKSGATARTQPVRRRPCGSNQEQDVEGPVGRTSTGRVDVLRKVMSAGPVFQAGTLSGNPLARTARFGRFFWAMMDRGFYLPCSQFEAAFLSAVHTEKHVEETLTAPRDALLASGG